MGVYRQQYNDTSPSTSIHLTVRKRVRESAIDIGVSILWKMSTETVKNFSIDIAS